MTRSVLEAFAEFLSALPAEYRDWFGSTEDSEDYADSELWQSS